MIAAPTENRSPRTSASVQPSAAEIAVLRLGQPRQMASQRSHQAEQAPVLPSRASRLSALHPDRGPAIADRSPCRRLGQCSLADASLTLDHESGERAVAGSGAPRGYLRQSSVPPTRLISGLRARSAQSPCGDFSLGAVPEGVQQAGIPEGAATSPERWQTVAGDDIGHLGEIEQAKRSAIGAVTDRSGRRPAAAVASASSMKYFSNPASVMISIIRAGQPPAFTSSAAPAWLDNRNRPAPSDTSRPSERNPISPEITYEIVLVGVAIGGIKIPGSKVCSTIEIAPVSEAASLTVAVNPGPALLHGCRAGRRRAGRTAL